MSAEPTVAELAELVHRSQRFSSPALWNDTGRPPSHPLGPPAELLVSEDSIAGSLSRFSHDPTLNRVRDWDPHRLEQHCREDEQPLPVAADRVGYYAQDDLAYWLSGVGDYLLLAETAEELDRPLSEGCRFLDFGCASGRILRHFGNLAPAVEAIGVDLCRQHVAWARRHLDAPVLQGTALPNLPFADAAIDIVFAGSVFTHISDFEEAWLAELRRVLAPGGFALVTFHSEDAWEGLRADQEHPVRQEVRKTPHRLEPLAIEPVTDATFETGMPAERVVLEAVEWPSANVFHSRSYVREKWGRLLRVERLSERSHGYQDSVVLRPG